MRLYITMTANGTKPRLTISLSLSLTQEASYVYDAAFSSISSNRFERFARARFSSRPYCAFYRTFGYGETSGPCLLRTFSRASLVSWCLWCVSNKREEEKGEHRATTKQRGTTYKMKRGLGRFVRREWNQNASWAAFERDTLYNNHREHNIKYNVHLLSR